jgi:hypothetical protein
MRPYSNVKVKLCNRTSSALEKGGDSDGGEIEDASFSVADARINKARHLFWNLIRPAWAAAETDPTGIEATSGGSSPAETNGRNAEEETDEVIEEKGD